MMGPSQTNKEEQQQPIQDHPTGECAREATKGEVTVDKLNILRDAVMSGVISQLDGELNPRPAYNSEAHFEYNRFCEGCLDKVAIAIMDGLRKEGKNGTPQKEDAPRPIVPIVKEEEKEEKNDDDDYLSTDVSSCPSKGEEQVVNDAKLAARSFLNKLNFRVNDHVSLEFFNRNGMKKCLDRDLFGGLPYEVARVVDRYDGKYAISEKLLGQHAYAATRSTGIVYDENDQEPIIRLSDHSGLTVGEVLSSAIGDKRCICMQSESFKDKERELEEELASLVKSANINNDTALFNNSRVDEDRSVFYSEEDDSKEKTVADGVKCRDDFRPSRSAKAESERGDVPPLCLSICRHRNDDCPFNAKNKRKIFNAIDFIKQELDGQEGDGEVIIDGERHKIELRTTSIPSFAIGSSIFEVLVYDHGPLAVSEWEDEEEATTDLAGVLCGQIFAKPCAKAYLTVTTAAVPWPCVLKTPPVSDFNSEGKYGSFRSFVVPLPCSYGGRRLNDPTNGWRSRIYSNFVEDFVKRSVRPVPKSCLLDLSDRTWNLSTRDVAHHKLKVSGSILRSECGDLDPSPLEYNASTSPCSRDAVEAQSDFAKLRRLLDTYKKDLDTFIDRPYRDATFRMRSIASEIEQEIQKEEEGTARKDLLETLNKQFEVQQRCVVFMSELATKHNNFRLQLERQLDNLSHLCASFVPGFKKK